MAANAHFCTRPNETAFLKACINAHAHDIAKERCRAGQNDHMDVYAILNHVIHIFWRLGMMLNLLVLTTVDQIPKHIRIIAEEKPDHLGKSAVFSPLWTDVTEN